MLAETIGERCQGLFGMVGTAESDGQSAIDRDAVHAKAILKGSAIRHPRVGLDGGAPRSDRFRETAEIIHGT